jgi:uncharacterized protein (UPF0333 family)
MNYTIILAVLILVVGMVVAYFTGSFITKKGISIKTVETDVEKVINYAESAADALAPFLPSPYNSIISVIEKYVAKAVNTVESLYNASQLTGDQRKVAATTIITKDLQDLHINVDANVQKLISVAIDSACIVLPNHITTTVATSATSTEVTKK